MPTGKITKRAVDALKASDKPVILWDDEVRGFGCKATPGGRRANIYQYRVGGRGGRTVRKEIGTHGALTPDQARDRARELRVSVDAGVDPVAADRAAKAAEKAAKAEAERREAEAARLAQELRVDALADRFLAEYIGPKKPRSHGYYERTLRLHVAPVIGEMPLPTVKKADVNRVLARIPAGSTALRRNVFAVTRSLASWAADALDFDNPLIGVKPPESADARDRVLDDDELALAWRAAGKEAGLFRAFYRLLIATGQRREEVAGLDWRELDRAAATWTLPAGRAKNGEASTVPLNALALAELDRLAGGEKWPKKGLALTTTGKTGLSGYSRAKGRLDATMLRLARAAAVEAGEDADDVEVTPWRVHDLRRTVATGLQRLGVRFEVTEAVLNHVSGSRSGIAGVYQRHKWTGEKRAALDAWGRHIEQILAPPVDAGNVIPLARAG